MDEMISGMCVMGYTIAGVFFLRYWKAIRDRLFLLFAFAFWIFALQRILLALAPDSAENGAAIYGVRLLGFAIILWAIADKNIRARKQVS